MGKLKDLLGIDAAVEADRIITEIRNQVSQVLRRKGAVVGLSGGIDSSVVAALLTRALGSKRVLAVLMPEAESSSDAQRLGLLVADLLGIETLVENITPLLEAAGCYFRRDEAIRSIIPDYDSDYRCKIELPDLLAARSSTFRIYSVVVQSPDGTITRARLTPQAYYGIVAATSFKQRMRKMVEYYHADRLHFAVAGTPNRLEYDQGFFVKSGDGAADLKPIAHLYKSQVYRLGHYLGIPDEIVERPPTTDTYSLEQSQEEFYFSLPHEQMDICLLGKNFGMPPEEVARECNLTPQQVALVYQDIESKRRATQYQHLMPLLVEPIPEITG